MKNTSNNKRKLLIAEYNDITRMLLKEAFINDYLIEEAADGVQTLDILRSVSDISVVLLDLSMPNIDGYGVMKAMQSDELLKGIPVVVITESDDEKSQVCALESGAFDIMFKPINLKVVHNRVKTIILRQDALKAVEQNTLLVKQLHDSEIDAKTGIFTQQAFLRNTEKLLKENPYKKYLLLRFDVDNFKLYNDAFGIAEGDKLLAQLGEYCRTYALPGMVYGHYEADHFAVCMEQPQFPEQKLLPTLAMLKSAQHSSFELTVRIGVYNIDDPTLPVALMCDRALMALRSIKGYYTERIAYYNDEIRLSMIEEQQISSEMATALEGGQFVVYVQPQYNQADMSLYGAEALARWDHPDKGIISPGKFIPIFERNGFITRLDRYIFEQVCKLQRLWLDAGLSVVPVSVNLSRRNIYSADLCGFIIGTLKKYSLSPNLVPLEITESAYMENPRQLVGVVEQLKKAGLLIEMDDFGSGYSSLNTLKDVPVDILKLDMEFLTKGMENPRGNSILASVVRMAHWLKLPVIAEGVETQIQANYLKSIGCFYIQGYYFDTPMPVSEFEDRLLTHEPDITRDHRFTEDVKGAMDFLSASTQSALLFNSFVGGAGIIEYDGSNVEGLRFNDKFYEAVCIPRNVYQDFQLQMRSRFDDDNWKIYTDTIKYAIETRDESVCEIQTKPIGDRTNPIWTRTRMRFLAQNGDRYILYISVDNIDQHMRLLERNTKLSEQLSTVMDSVPGGILDFEVNEATRITFSNETIASMFGYGHAEYIHLFADDPYSAIHPDDRAETKAKAETAFRSGSGYIETEYRHLCKDGSSKWVRLSGKVICRKNNTCYGSGIVMNIDEEVRMKKVSAEQAEQIKRRHVALKALYDTIPCGIMEFTLEDDQPKLAGFNDTAWRILGYKHRSEYIAAQRGKDLLMHTYPGEFEMVQDIIRRGLKANPQKPLDFEHRIIRTDGSIRWVHFYLQKASYAEREATLQCVFTDITEQKLNVEKCLGSARLPSAAGTVSSHTLADYAPSGTLSELDCYRLVLDQTGIAVFEMDFQTGTFYSSEIYKKYEMSRCDQKEVFQNSADRGLVHPDDTERLEAFFKAGSNVNNHIEAVLRLKMTDGSFRWTRMIGLFVRDETGKVLHAIGTLMDIDDATHSAESLRQLSERLGQIVLNMPSGIAIYELRNSSMLLIYVSEQTCRMFGYTREEYELCIINGENIDFMPDKSQLSQDDMSRLLAGEIVSIPRIHAQKKDGSRFWLRFSAHAVTQKSGTVLIYAVLTDITRNVNNEILIDGQNRELAAIVASVPGGICKYSAQSDEFSYVSDTLLSMLGYTRNEFEQKFHNRFSEMVWHEDREAALKKINADISANGNTDSCEYRIETKSGHLKWVYDVGRLITTDDGKQWYIVTVIDHDEKKAYETKLTELNSRISAMIQNSPSGIASFRINKNRWTLEYMSNGMLALLGYTSTELERLLSSDVLTLVHPADRNNVALEMSGISEKKRTYSVQYRIKRKSGDYFWIAASGNFVGEAGKGVCYMSYVDISNIKRMEEQLSSDKQQMETIINSIPGGVATYEVQPDGIALLYASDGIGEISGRTAEEYRQMISKRKSMGIYPPDEAKVLSTIRRAMENGEDIDINYRIVHLNGNIVWLNLRGRRNGEHNGNPVFLAVFHNISTATGLYQHILMETNIALVVADSETKEILFVNNAAEAWSGISHQRATSMHCYQYMHDRDTICDECTICKYTKEWREIEIEKDGRYYSLRQQNIDWNGRSAFISYISDITLEKRVRQQIDNVVRNIPGGLAVFMVSNGNVKLTYMSSSAKQLLGYSETDDSQSDSSDIFSCVHPDDKDSLQNELLAAVNSGSEINLEYRIIDQSGDIRWVNFIANPVTESSGALYFYGIYTDISQRKSDEARAHAERQHQIEKYKSELKNLLATPGDNLLEKLYIDITTGELINTWVRQAMCLPYSGLDFEKAAKRLAYTGLNETDKVRLAEMLSRDGVLGLLKNPSESEASLEYQRISPSGRISWVMTTVRAFLDPESGHTMAFLFTHDIDDKKMPFTLTERLVSQDTELLGLIGVKTGLLHAYMVSELDDIIACGCDSDYTSNCKLFVQKYIKPDSRAEALISLELETIKDRLSNTDTSYRCNFWVEKDGKRAHKSWVFSYLDEGKTSIIIMRNDTTSAFLASERNKRALQNALQEVEISKFDSVTGLYNRACTIQEISAQLSDPSIDDFAMLMIDIDDLKHINDAFGHPQGDRALATFASVLRSHFRKTDIIGRIGGDEFMVFISGIACESALITMLRKLILDANTTLVDESEPFPIQCSIGVTLGKHGRFSFDELYDQADRSLYQAKQSGKNRFSFYSAIS